MKAVAQGRYGAPDVLEVRDVDKPVPGDQEVLFWCPGRTSWVSWRRSAATTSSTNTREDFTRDGRRYDVVLDLVGNRPLGELRRALTPTGTLVLSGGGTSEGGSLPGLLVLFLRRRLLNPFVGQRPVELPARPSRANLTTPRELVESGGSSRSLTGPTR
ncbi:hypothetical protein [Streptomyces sp. 8K308]|uniref:hypothetical protein n=1 Tax=Streptomyces sp. 8K308 TaxID=2530388 RepID=UPI002692F08E